MEQKEMLFNLLSDEKQLSKKYNNILHDCTNKKIRSEILNVLENQNNIVFEITDELIKRKYKNTNNLNSLEKEKIKKEYEEKMQNI